MLNLKTVNELKFMNNPPAECNSVVVLTVLLMDSLGVFVSPQIEPIIKTVLKAKGNPMKLRKLEELWNW